MLLALLCAISPGETWAQGEQVAPGELVVEHPTLINLGFEWHIQGDAAATGQDRNSVLVDYDIFMNVPQLDRNDLETVQQVHDARELDFRLRPGSAAVDRGTEIPNVTDGFDGVAPDLGALEVGQPMPLYGPRNGMTPQP